MNNKHKLEDYRVIRLIGKGSFGEILLVERDNQQFAMKKISKKQIIKVNKMHEPFIQRQILFRFKTIAPNCFVTLYQTHSDNEYIYMIMEYCDGGSLESVIKHMSEIGNKYQVIKKIIIKIVIILQTMHKYGVVHRDLKPSNFLFMKDGTLKLADFGTAYAKQDFFTEQIAKNIAQYRQISKKRKNQKVEDDIRDSTSTMESTRRATFVGTPLYMAPELLEQDFCGFQADLWAFGCIIYELINLKPPFYDENEGMVWKKILSEDYNQSFKVQEGQIVKLAHYQTLIKALLVKEREKRLGSGENGYNMVRAHPFFANINWEAEINKPIKEIVPFLEKNKNLAEKQIMQNGEQKILFSGAVSKKMYFGNYKQRMLVLHSTPKLVYYDMQTGQQKGEIALTKQTPIGNEGSKIFTISNQKKTYYFKSVKAHEWIEMIKYAVINAFY